jgi:hypothetical protein
LKRPVVDGADRRSGRDPRAPDVAWRRFDRRDRAGDLPGGARRALLPDLPSGDGRQPAVFAGTAHHAGGGRPRPTVAKATRVDAIGPEPVARIVALRLARLPPEAEQLARAVAILGGTADRRLAAQLAGVPAEAADAALTRLAQVEILRLEPRLDFTHPIIRSSVYERLTKVERMRAHNRAAELLIAGGAEPEQVAAHLMLVTPGGGGEILPVLRDAARRALVRGAADTAVEYLRRALQQSSTPELKAELLSQLGLAERGVDLAASVDHLHAAIEVSADVERQAELALECGRALYFGLRNEEARDVFTQATARLGAPSGPARAARGRDHARIVVRAGAVSGGARVARTRGPRGVRRRCGQ